MPVKLCGSITNGIRSIETRLIVVLLFLTILPTTAVGWIVYDLMFENIRSERITSVGEVADSRHAQLVMMLMHENSRAKSFLADLGAQCDATELNWICASHFIKSYLASENALGAVLRRKGSDSRLTFGTPSLRSVGDMPLQAWQLAKFSGTGPENNRLYLISVAEQSSGLQLEVTYPSSNLQHVFDRPANLGSLGETFLTDGDGYFVTETRYPSTQGHSHPVSAGPMQSCLSRKNSEVIDQDYRGVPMVMGFRFVPELGSACIMVHTDRAEAFAPLMRIEKKIFIALLIFLQLALLAVIHTARRIAKPVINLTKTARTIAQGDYHARADMNGHGEVAELATAFNAMTDQLTTANAQLEQKVAELEQSIVQRKEVEERLRVSEERWKFALEGAGDGVWDWDIESGNIMFSERNKEMLGYAGNEVWSSPNEWRDRINEEDIHYAMQELEAYLDGKRAAYTSEYRIRCKDGSWKWILGRGMVARRAADGRPLRMIGTHTDISKVREAEQHTQELLRQNRILARRMFNMQEDSLRQISAELHDELGQWLTAIQAEAHAINSIAGGASTIQDSAQAIGHNADAMHAVIDRMVHNLRPSLLDAFGLVDSLWELEKQWCQPRLGIACDFVLASDLGDLSDELEITLFRLVQEALNNIANHAQASHISVQLQKVAAETDDVILLNIEDNGVGFDPAQPTGGVGLLGMRERTIAAGGKFDLYSKPGQGVRIDIRLPLGQMERRIGTERREA